MRQFIFAAHFFDNPGWILEFEALAIAGAACPDLRKIVEISSQPEGGTGPLEGLRLRDGTCILVVWIGFTG